MLEAVKACWFKSSSSAGRHLPPESDGIKALAMAGVLSKVIIIIIIPSVKSQHF
jgi:hypothetical protein